MKIRKVSAHYIFPGNTSPIKFGILEFDDKGEIISLVDTKGKLKESAGLEFYNGMIVPGFVVANIRENLLALSGKEFQRVEIQEITDETKAMNNKLIKSNEDIKKVISLIYSLQELLPSCKLEDLVALFTSKSAIALGIENEYGTFEKGMKPGINILVDPDLHRLKVKKENRFIILFP